MSAGGEYDARAERAYVIADNKLALSAPWTSRYLAEELQDLILMDPQFDIETTGFSIPDIDDLIDSLSPEEPGNPDDDELPEIPQGPPVSSAGDLWLLGDHLVFCGSALHEATYIVLFGDELARPSSPILHITLRLPAKSEGWVRSNTASS